MLWVVAGPASAGPGGDPPGNVGTVKIDGQPFDDVPDNEPDPGCVFQVDFYGFDAGDLAATVTFEAVAPTAGDVLLTDHVPIGEDSHAGGGSERGLDASRTYDLSSELSGTEPQRNQGWHVRLTVNAEGSKGSDLKHKVFWVDGCQPAAAPAAASAETSGPSELPPSSTSVSKGTVGAAAQGAAATPAVAPPAESSGRVMAAEFSAAPPAPIPAEVLGETVTRSPSVAGPAALARTGMSMVLVLVGLGLLGGGLAFVRGAALGAAG